MCIVDRLLGFYDITVFRKFMLNWGSSFIFRSAMGVLELDFDSQV